VRKQIHTSQRTNGLYLPARLLIMAHQVNSPACTLISEPDADIYILGDELMQNAAATQPQATEYAPYYQKYTALVPEGDVVETLRSQLEQSLQTLRSLSEEQAGGRYAPGKWSIKEVIGHMIDSERVFSYRALRFARGDSTPLPGYEQDDYVSAGKFDSRTLPELIEEFEQVRRATLCLLRSFDDEAWLRRGLANETEVSVRALAYIMAGHETHHMQIVRERYL
jgi:uncharacterized damage-inducible protein DinB